MIKKCSALGIFIILLSVFVTASDIVMKMNPSELTISDNIKKDTVITEQPTPEATIAATPAATAETTVQTPEPLKYLELKKYPVAKNINVTNKNILINKAVNAPKLRYLIENGITIEQINIKENEESKSFQASYPRISGLINENVQNKINIELKEYSERLINYAKDNKESLREMMSSYQVRVNANNILCISFNTQYFFDGFPLSEFKTFTYELANGQRLELEDLFGSNVDYVEILNNLVKTYILENNLDETCLKKPFQGIREEQAFYFDENKFYIKIDMKNDEFVNYTWYMLPLEIPVSIKDLPGLNDLYIRHMNNSKIYRVESNSRIFLQNDIEITPIYERKYLQSKYSIELTGLKFTKSGNPELENTLNNCCKTVIPDNFIKEVSSIKSKQNTMSHYTKTYTVRANFMDFLCIMSYENWYTENNKKYTIDAAAYNLKTGKKLKLQDLFVKGFDYKKAIYDVISSAKYNKPTLTTNELDKVLDSNPKFHFDAHTLIIDVSKITSSNKSIYVSFKDIGEKNVIFYNIE